MDSTELFDTAKFDELFAVAKIDLSRQQVKAFVRESNLIEGIHRDPTPAEIAEHERFMALDKIAVADLETFVSVYQPDAFLRDRDGMSAFIQQHEFPKGGPAMRECVEQIVFDANTKRGDQNEAYRLHHIYESLHPFSDGNGRSGRMLWCWMMGAGVAYRLPFLQAWYYQSLTEGRYRVGG